MKKIFQKLHKKIEKKGLSIPVVLVASVISLIAWYVTYTQNLVLVYNDAMSHINISRLVIDNLQPGLSQLGSVWLPLGHILPIPFIWNDWAWHSGFAGSIVSMISYVVAVWAIYKTVFILTKKYIASILAGLAYAVNINILYLQATPMTESLYLALFALSVLIFVNYLTTRKENMHYLLILGFLGFLQVLTRYDGWFVVIAQALLIVGNETFIVKRKFAESLSKVFLFGAPVVLGVGLWFLWNALIFGHPLYFAVGPYSARAQQATIEQTAELITKGDIITSTRAYFYAMRDNVGLYTMALATIALSTFFLIKSTITTVSRRLLVVFLLISPILFNIIALFLGFSILNIPDLHWNPSGSPEGSWFNVRYGVLALPFAAILIGLFASWRKLAAIIALEIILFQVHIFSLTGAITITDGTIGSSAFRNTDVAKVLQGHVSSEDKVLMSLSTFNPVAFQSQLPLRQFIHEGVQTQWQTALINPVDHAAYVVMSSNNEGEIVRRLMLTENKAFLDVYERIYKDNEAEVYKRKAQEVAVEGGDN
ncbi:MAG: glycosyltransferase family 39 protein [Patescibacteria group bacterium]